MQDYVVTEEDALEFVHSLQSAGTPGEPVQRPRRAAAAHHRLQLSGLAGALLHPGRAAQPPAAGARQDRLRRRRQRTRATPALLAFLRNFKTRTEFFHHADAVAFVDELHRALACTPRRRARRRADVTAAVDMPAMHPGAVFLSYASDDRPAAQAIRDALDAAGIDVWFDRDRLMAGDAFEAKIRRNIERCSLFIPVLSRSTRDARAPLLPARVGPRAACRHHRARVQPLHPAGRRSTTCRPTTRTSRRSSARCIGSRLPAGARRPGVRRSWSRSSTASTRAARPCAHDRRHRGACVGYRHGRRRQPVARARRIPRGGPAVLPGARREHR